MKVFSVIAGFLTIILWSSCQYEQPAFNEVIEVYDNFSDLEEVLKAYDDQTLVINFWATSCPPCIKEMPHFNKLEETAQASQTKIILVSLDEAKLLESRVYPFVDKYSLTPEVALLNDQYYSSWTDAIDPSWYGALPATLIVRGEQRKFKFGAYSSHDELMSDVREVSVL